MEKPPVAAPRTFPPKPVEVCRDDMFKKPPPVAAITHKIVKLGAQPLPGLMHSSESNQQSEKADFPEQKKNVADVKGGFRSLTLQSTSQTSVESKCGPQEKPHATHGVLLRQQSQLGDFQPGLYLRPFDERRSFIQCHQGSQDNVDIMEWWQSEEPWRELKSSGTKKTDEKAFMQNAENLKRALYVYNCLMSDQAANLQGHIIELQEVANGIDKVHKGVKIAGITGGAAGAVGVVAAVGGVILAPVTMGASLAVTAVGVGVATAGGITGASAAITNKVHTKMDRKMVETILKTHHTQMEEIERCVKFISTTIESLKKYDLSTIKGMKWKAMKMARMAYYVGDSLGAIGAISKSSGMIQGFALGLDIYFSQEDSKQLKKGSETKFAKKIRKVAKQMQVSLDELMAFKNKVDSEDM